jgi:hypothetical protein
MAKTKKTPTHALSYEEVQNIKAALWMVPQTPVTPQSRAAMLPKHMQPKALDLFSAPPRATLVAEGDSWFDYLPGLDVLDQLKIRHGYDIVKLSAAGDTLENIAFGTEINRDFSRMTPQINTLIKTVSRVRPRVVLLSGGGNDIAGESLDAFLNHADSGLPGLRTDYMNDVFHGLFRSAFERLAQSIWQIDPNICVITHGYGRPIPDGRAVLNFPFNFRFVGPWIRPSFTRKNIMSLATAAGIVGTMIDEFNTMLEGLQTSLGPNFKYVDVRQVISSEDWVNELHLNNEAYGRVADAFHSVIKKRLAT